VHPAETTTEPPPMTHRGNGPTGEVAPQPPDPTRHALALRFERADFDVSGLAAFLQAHLDELAPTAPEDSRHALNLTELQSPHVRLWVAYDATRIAVTGALASLDDGHEELKAMRTDPELRGRGAGRRMLTHLVDDARRRGVRRISLETGSMAFFAPARALYESAGFIHCPPFGSYVEDANSVFMTRQP
jgi:putative acetyltransferase